MILKKTLMTEQTETFKTATGQSVPLDCIVMPPTLMQGDCLKLMFDIPDNSVDMVCCDMPYGTTACKWDTVLPLDMLWHHYRRIVTDTGVIVLTASQPFTSALVASAIDMFKQALVWDKKMPTGHLNAKKKPLMRHEDILVFSRAKFGRMTYSPIMRKGAMRNKSPKRKADDYADRVYGTVKHKGDTFNDDYYPTTIIEVSNANQTEKQHPTQKPVALIEQLISTYTKEGDTVLDNCMGSGTTGVACKNLSRNFIGIELDPVYFEIARKRIEGHNAN